MIKYFRITNRCIKVNWNKGDRQAAFILSIFYPTTLLAVYISKKFNIPTIGDE